MTLRGSSCGVHEVSELSGQRGVANGKRAVAGSAGR
jgi:hypothetical protein